MQGLMQDIPLTLVHAFERCERLFGAKTVVTSTGNGTTSITYTEWADRTRRLGGAFADLGLTGDGRVATFGWNSARHLERYFAAPCSGRVLHTLNIRLFAEQLVFIANHAEESGQVDVSSIRTLLCGGSAVPRALMEGYQRQGVWISHAWGMTETSPIASVSQVKSSLGVLSTEQEVDCRLTQGLPSPLVDARIVEPGSTTPLSCDGEATGELQVRGPWIAADYYRPEGSAESPSTVDGWLKTGDVAAIDREGYIRLVDRTKDLVKSGGEWISSVELENAIMGHPAVVEAAVVGVPHPKWDERPLACVVLRPGESLSRDELRAYLDGKVAKWWLPDDVVVIDAVPKTSVGKFDKKVLRQQFAAHQLPA
ncbi:MAG: hypothetical protein NVS3B12_25110 [Acidimicrobiales bacterium]